MPEPRVMIDTSAWVEFFNRPDSPEKQTIDLLIDSDRAAVCGVTLAELLQGTRTQKEFHQVRDSLQALPYYEMDAAAWEKVGDLGFTLRRKGITMPVTDLAVAALALTHGMSVLACDSHFAEIPGLQFMQVL